MTDLQCRGRKPALMLPGTATVTALRTLRRRVNWIACFTTYRKDMTELLKVRPRVRGRALSRSLTVASR